MRIWHDWTWLIVWINLRITLASFRITGRWLTIGPPGDKTFFVKPSSTEVGVHLWTSDSSLLWLCWTLSWPFCSIKVVHHLSPFFACIDWVDDSNLSVLFNTAVRLVLISNRTFCIFNELSARLIIAQCSPVALHRILEQQLSTQQSTGSLTISLLLFFILYYSATILPRTQLNIIDRV